jgi:multiple sugar transport system substrate-binding protein
MSMRMRAALAAGALLLGTQAPVSQVFAQQRTEITFARFFGTCDADYGQSQDVEHSRGECGVMTTLVNRFNATNTQGITVRPQIIEWGPYYQQLTARIAARDVPTIAVMHTSQIGDFIRARVVEPIESDLQAAGIDAADFTQHARNGVSYEGHIYALPWDTHSWLWHINVGMFRRAGLVDASGQPILPRNVEELLAQAARIREATGKPYFIMGALAGGDAANAARTFYTMLYQQNGTLFPAGYERADFNTPAGRAVFNFFEQLQRANAMTRALDGSAALAGFLNGEGAIMLTGTWRIDDFLAAQARPGSPLSEGYAARIFPNLFQTEAVWADNHSWVLLRGGNNARTRAAAMVFMRYLWDNNFQWARGGGHLPVRMSLMAQYTQLPQRENVVRITQIGRALPHDVRRQFGFQALIGEELSNVINGNKPADQALVSAQERADQLLSSRR